MFIRSATIGSLLLSLLAAQPAFSQLVTRGDRLRLYLGVDQRPVVGSVVWATDDSLVLRTESGRWTAAWLTLVRVDRSLGRSPRPAAHWGLVVGTIVGTGWGAYSAIHPKCGDPGCIAKIAAIVVLPVLGLIAGGVVGLGVGYGIGVLAPLERWQELGAFSRPQRGQWDAGGRIRLGVRLALRRR